MAFTLPPLPYDYTALEPHLDEQTMRIHHDKHHAAYVTNLNAALEGQAALAGKGLEALLGDSLMGWLQRSPTLTPHRFSPPSRGFTTEDSRLERRLVLTGDSQQLQSLARRAFAARSMVLDTIVLVRDRGAEASGP